MKKTIVITSAGGKQVASFLPHLLQEQVCDLRLVVSSLASKERLASTYPTVEVIQADLTKPDDCLRVADGATSLFHIGPTFHPRETDMGLNMIDAATHHAKQNNHVPVHFVYSSVLHSQLRKMLHHDAKRYVEEYLMESGLNYTILQPTTFLDNIPAAMLAKQDNPVFPAMWDPDVEFSMLALRDFGQVAAKVLLEGEQHWFAEYALTSTIKPVSFGEVVKEVGRRSGKEITIERKTLGEATTMICAGMFGGDADKAGQKVKESAERMILYYERHGLKASTGVLEWLLGRKATGYMEFVEMQFRG